MNPAIGQIWIHSRHPVRDALRIGNVKIDDRCGVIRVGNRHLANQLQQGGVGGQNRKHVAVRVRRNRQRFIVIICQKAAALLGMGRERIIVDQFVAPRGDDVGSAYSVEKSPGSGQCRVKNTGRIIIKYDVALKSDL